jgi:hypothetical protein
VGVGLTSSFPGWKLIRPSPSKPDESPTPTTSSPSRTSWLAVPCARPHGLYASFTKPLRSGCLRPTLCSMGCLTRLETPAERDRVLPASSVLQGLSPVPPPASFWAPLDLVPAASLAPALFAAPALTCPGILSLDGRRFYPHARKNKADRDSRRGGAQAESRDATVPS